MTYAHTVRYVHLGEPINALMSWPVAVVETTDSLAEVARALAENEVGAVLVLLDGELVGWYPSGTSPPPPRPEPRAVSRSRQPT